MPDAARREMVHGWLAGYTYTKDTLSCFGLRELFSLDRDDDLGDKPHYTCAGAWVPEMEAGTIVRWRFYQDPDWER